MPDRRRRLLVPVLLLAFAPAPSQAHHSVAGFFDPDTKVQIEGVITRIRWRNPHTAFIVEVTDTDGTVTEWNIESGALGVLRTRGLSKEFVKAGDFVKILGDKSLRSDTEMFARNMLLPDGKEVLLTVPSRPHFSVDNDAGVVEGEFDPAVVAAARASADGIFRVWSDNFSVRLRGGRIFTGNYPLNEAAKAVRAEYDPGETSLLGCTDWSMPRLMANPLPMEFIDEGDRIVIRFEENDEVRVVHLDDGAMPGERTHMGFSTGRWEGETLVVETTHITPDRIDDRGTPFSADLHLLERFTPTADGSRLDYTVTVTDPNNFEEPFEQARFWDWRPEIVVQPYACEQDQEMRQE